MQHWPSYCIDVNICKFFVVFTDAQKFKVKFDECKEEIRKSLEGTSM